MLSHVVQVKELFRKNGSPCAGMCVGERSCLHIALTLTAISEIAVPNLARCPGGLPGVDNFACISRQGPESAPGYVEIIFDFGGDSMERSDAVRERLIKDVLVRRAGNAPDVAVWLWRSLAVHLGSIIGERAFSLLYARNLYLASEHFPWLPHGDASRQIDLQFTDLKNRLEGEDPVEAGNASHALLQSFTSLLVSLIGEPVTMTILSSAWAENVSERKTAGKEYPHE